MKRNLERGRLPRFFIIGAQKSASTFVHRALLDHPEVFTPDDEINFFEGSVYDADRLEDLSSLFSEASESALLGIKRPDYLGRTECAGRIRQHVPDAKLVAILRKPVDRAVSAYYHYMARGYFPCFAVESGMRAILNGEWDHNAAARSVLEYGLYGKHLDHWCQHFERDAIHVCLQEDVLGSPEEELKEIYRFLGIRSSHRSGNLSRKSQAVVYSTQRARFLSLFHRLTRRTLSDGMNHVPRLGALSNGSWMIAKGIDKFILAQIFPSVKPQLSVSLRKDLEDYYRADIARLEDWLGRSLSGWIG